MLQSELSFAFFVGDVCVLLLQVYYFAGELFTVTIVFTNACTPIHHPGREQFVQTTYSVNSAPLMPLPTPSGIPKPSTAVSPATATILCTRSNSHDLLAWKRLTGQKGQGVMEQKRRSPVEKARPLSADIPAPGPQYIGGREPRVVVYWSMRVLRGGCKRASLKFAFVHFDVIHISMSSACMQTVLGGWADAVQLRSPLPGLGIQDTFPQYTVPYILPLFGGITSEGCLKLDNAARARIFPTSPPLAIYLWHADAAAAMYLVDIEPFHFPTILCGYVHLSSGSRWSPVLSMLASCKIWGTSFFSLYAEADGPSSGQGTVHGFSPMKILSADPLAQTYSTNLSLSVVSDKSFYSFFSEGNDQDQVPWFR
ncbi:hypothetical protein EDD16DRAFT_1521139 [Pisolithus croceorrhizus]|nr:hypothetical protein EDD16DRAFT_1521139 [Pisolithus croceorrhizus]KAI6165429.1 hypothetical protein EDD17DRAFT_1505886 [Pisolithus thermaeus]